MIEFEEIKNIINTINSNLNNNRFICFNLLINQMARILVAFERL